MTRHALQPARPRFLKTRLPAYLAVAALAVFAGCSGGGGSAVQPIVTGGGSPTKAPTASPTPKASATPTATATPTSPSSPVSSACSGGTTSTIGATGGTITASASTGTFSEVVASGQFSASTSVSLGYVAQSALPAPLYRTRHLVNGRVSPMFTQGAGNTYVMALCTSFGTAPSSGISLTGTGVVSASVPVGTQLNIAINTGGTYVDVGTALVSAGGNFSSSLPTVALPGITQSGTYLVYIPASGTNTSQVNFGFAIAGDDGTAYVAPGLQFVQIEDTSGNAIPTPTTTFFPIPNTSDLDGQSLTSDAAHGATVDGSNDVYFFSGIPQHTFTLSSTPIDVSNYGGDGDSIASLPGGDQAVVSGNGTQLAVISGILANAPVIADAINNGDNMTYDRDGLVSSGDGKVLLSRGSSGLDVFAVTPVAAHAGSTGTGTTSFSFNLVTTFSTSAATNPISSPVGEDGRDGMAISPTDSSRAVVVGYGGGGPIVQLLTGLTGASPTLSSLPLRLPAVQHREVPAGFQRPEPSAHRRPFALTPTGVTYPYGVSISPNGTTAYIATDAGIVTVSGVNTGTLTQVGSVYAPTVTAAGGTSCAISNSQRGYSLGILPDGKYLVVDYPCYLQPTGTTNTTQSYGVLLTIPIGTGGVLGAPVGQLNQVVVPTNDQLLVH